MERDDWLFEPGRPRDRHKEQDPNIKPPKPRIKPPKHYFPDNTVIDKQTALERDREHDAKLEARMPTPEQAEKMIAELRKNGQLPWDNHQGFPSTPSRKDLS